MPSISSPFDHWTFPWWLAIFLGGFAASIGITLVVLGLYFRVAWYRSYSELGWRIRLWFFRRKP